MLAPSSALDVTAGCIEVPLVTTIPVAAAPRAARAADGIAGVLAALSRPVKPARSDLSGCSGTLSGRRRNTVRVPGTLSKD